MAMHLFSNFTFKVPLGASCSRFPIPDSRFPIPDSRFPKRSIPIHRCLFDHLTNRFQHFCDLTRLWGDNSIQSALGADWVVAALLMSFGRLTSKSLWETDVDVLRETDKGEESPGFIEQGAR